MKKTIWLLGGFTCMILSFLLIWSISFHSLPKLHLKCRGAEVKQGEYFDAGVYIASSISDTGRLILPDVDTSQPGRQAVIYRLMDETYEVDQILIVDVKK